MMKNIFRYIGFILLSFLGCFNLAASSQLQQGEVTFTANELQSGVVGVGGEAVFYHEAFYSWAAIKDEPSDPVFLMTSYSWNDQPSGYPSYESWGYGTYYFKINIPDEFLGKTLILRPTDYISYSSMLFINGQECANNGVVGTSLKDGAYSPSRHVKVHSFIADTTVLDVVIWVSNYHHFRGGVLRSFTMGTEDNMVHARERAIFIDLFVIVSLLIMFLYHIIFFCVNRATRASLYFSIFCLLLSVDLSFRGAMTYFIFFPASAYDFYSPLHLIVPYFIPGVFTLFLGTLFPGYVSKRVIVFGFVVGAVATLITLFGNSEWGNFVIKPFFIVTAYFILYGFFIAIRLLRKRVFASQLFAISYVIFAICAANDLLDMFEIVQTKNLLSYGTLVFVLLLSVLYGTKGNKLQDEVSDLSEELTLLNKDLEDKVALRTNELNSSMADLNQLNDFQEGMTHMIAYDLRGSLTQIVNLDRIKDTNSLQLKNSGYQMLNLIQNMLDLYRFNNGRVTISKSQFNVVKAVDEVILEFAFLIQKKGIKVEVIDYESYELDADIRIFKRVVTNLLSNAIRHSPDGGLVQIRLKVHEGECLRVLVSNEGPALDDVAQSHLFSSEKVFDHLRDENKHNSGLGLYLCKLSVEAHEGSIGVESDGVLGVLFWFVLPGLTVTAKVEDASAETAEQLLTPEDSRRLHPFVLDLIACEVYDSSKINAILEKIPQDIEAVKYWCYSVKKACYQLDEVKYNELLDLVHKR